MNTCGGGQTSVSACFHFINYIHNLLQSCARTHLYSNTTSVQLCALEQLIGIVT